MSSGWIVREEEEEEWEEVLVVESGTILVERRRALCGPLSQKKIMGGREPEEGISGSRRVTSRELIHKSSSGGVIQSKGVVVACAFVWVIGV